MDLRIERTATPFTADYRLGEVIRIPVGHGEGRFTAPEPELDRIESEGQVVLRYHGAEGGEIPANPNGSARAIAAVCNREGNVVGMMPHPERLAEAVLGSDAGHRVFTSLIHHLIAEPSSR